MPDYALVDTSAWVKSGRAHVILSVRNLFDEEFLYQDLDSITNTTTRPRFIPARTILGRLSLSF